MNYKIESTELEQNNNIYEIYNNFIVKYKNKEELDKDFTLNYIKELQRSTKFEKITELKEICKNLNLSTRDIIIILNLGKFFRYEDLKDKENIKDADLEPVYIFLNKYF